MQKPYIHFLILFLILWSNIGHSDSQVTLISHAGDSFFAGESADGETISVFESNHIANTPTYHFKRKNLTTKKIETFSINQLTSASDLSPNAQYQIWVEQNSSDDALKIYDYDNQLLGELLVDSTSSPVAIKSPTFIKNSSLLQLAYLSGDKAFGYSFFNQIIIYDLTTGQTISIESTDLEVSHGWLSITDYQFSDDGRSVVYYLLNYYTGDDCCFLKPGYFVHHDLDTQQSTILLDQTSETEAGPFFFDISGDGETVVYQNQDKLIRFNPADASQTELSLNHINTASISWLQLSSDGQTLALKSQAKFVDKRASSYQQRFILNDDLPAGMNQTTLNRSQVITVNDLNTHKTDFVNQFNNHQLYSAKANLLSVDGSYLNHMTQQNNGQDNVDIYLRHTVDYGFKADATVTGQWFEPATSGQGLMITFAPDNNNNQGQAIVTWYTVDPQGKPLWLIMQAILEGNTLSGPAMMVTGSEFGANFDPNELEKTLWGTLSLEFYSCQSAKLNYQADLPDYNDGELELVRLSYQQGLGCL